MAAQGFVILPHAAFNPPAAAPARARAVNGFIAFRAYYMGVFHASMPQKHRSPFLRQLWEKDCYKGTWKLLGKAFTTVRDHVGNNAKIAEFLAIACPHVGVVSPGDYIATFHWQFQNDVDGGVSLVHDHTIKITVQGPGWTSEFDIVRHCVTNGYDIPDHWGLLKKMETDPEKIMNVLPDAEIHSVHFQNLLLENPQAAITRIVNGHPVADDAVNLVIVNNHNDADNDPTLFSHGIHTHYGSQGYTGINFQLDQEAITVGLYDWDHHEPTPQPGPYGLNIFGVHHDENALFDIGNAFGSDRLMLDFSATADEEGEGENFEDEHIWDHNSMNIVPVPAPEA